MFCVFVLDDGIGTLDLSISESHFGLKCRSRELVFPSPWRSTCDIGLLSVAERHVEQYNVVYMRRGGNQILLLHVGLEIYLLNTHTARPDLVKMITFGQ